MAKSAQQIRELIAAKIPANLVVPEHTSEGHFYRHSETKQVYASVTTKCGILDNPHLKKWSARLAVEYLDQHWQQVTPDNKNEFYKAAIMAHQEEFEQAGDIGTQGHGIVDTYLGEWMKSGVQPKDIRTFVTGEDYRLYAITRSAEMFCNDFNVEPVASELFVCSTKYRFAGTLDSLMMISRVIKLGDTHCAHDWWQTNTGARSGRHECIKCGRSIIKEFALVDWKTSNDIDKSEYAMQVSAYAKALYEMTGLKVKHIIIVRLDKNQAKYEVVRVASPAKAFTAFCHTAKVWEWLNNGEEKLPPLRPRQINKINYGNINEGATHSPEEVRGAETADKGVGEGSQGVSTTGHSTDS